MQATWTRQSRALSTRAGAIVFSERWLVLLVAFAVLLLVVTPLVTVVVCSFRPQDVLPFEPGAWTLDNFGAVFGDVTTYQLLFNTFLYALASLAAGLAIALTFAWLIERTNIPFANTLYVLILVPMAIPSLLSALGWILLLGSRQGIINLLLRELLKINEPLGPLDIYSFGGMVFITALAVVPSMLLLLGPLFRQLDPSLEESAATSGAGALTSLRRVTLPLMWPGILSLVIYYVIVMIEFFEIPLALGLNARFPVLSVQIYTHTRGEFVTQYGLAAAYSFIGLLLGLVLLYLYRRSISNTEKYAVIRGKGYARSRARLGWARYPAFGLVVLYLVLSVVLPVVILVWASLLAFYQPPSLSALAAVSLANYQSILQNQRFVTAAVNTLVLLITAATATVFFASLLSWVVNRRRPPFAGVLDAVVFLPLAVPSIVMALGIMLLYIRSAVWDTVWVIAIGQCVRYLPFTTRLISAAMVQIHKELEEAAYTSGASALMTFKKVTVPLLLPALANAWIWIAVHSMRDFTFPLMLISFNNFVLASLLWQYWVQGDLTKTATLAVVVIVASLVLSIGSRRVMVRLADAR